MIYGWATATLREKKIHCVKTKVRKQQIKPEVQKEKNNDAERGHTGVTGRT